MTILPGATLGMLGGGQLGRMFTAAARTMGYQVIVLDPDPDSPAGQLATRHLHAAYDDATALDNLANNCSAVSTEFENVPAHALEALADRCVVRPAAKAVQTTQDRIHEKTFLRDAGFPTSAFTVIRTGQDLEQGMRTPGAPAVLKISRLGYDGKGQAVVNGIEEVRRAWESMKHEPCVLESLVPLDTEISVVLGRGEDGDVATFPVGENTHRQGILDTTVVPANIPEMLAREAEEMARRVAERLEYIGVMAVEFFVSRGKLLVNEIAPRPHNSGHYTLDACATSQFEQQVRALCGLPLGETRLLSPVAMVNLLGDLWREGRPPDWEVVLRHPNAKLHLYGKREPRPGRKMGHYTVLASDRDKAFRLAHRIQEELRAKAEGRRNSKVS
ncbi:MAG: 5-(carboxyamino)imidazole ribonucleotide synthase [Gammaproteobacteria bacterium]|nr:5-(carboxyamino)imidazole ribonucleotide synthase [Gammaproteobacteria bacterium]